MQPRLFRQALKGAFTRIFIQNTQRSSQPMPISTAFNLVSANDTCSYRDQSSVKFTNEKLWKGAFTRIFIWNTQRSSQLIPNSIEWPDRAVKKKKGFKLCLSLMSFWCTIHPKRLIVVIKRKKEKKEAVICEKMTELAQITYNCVIFSSSITEKVTQVHISSHFYLMYLQLLCEVTEEFFDIFDRLVTSHNIT